MLRNFIYLFLFFISSCSGDTETVKPDINQEPQKEVNEVQALKTDNARLPEVLFNDIQKIKEGSTSTIISDKIVSYINATPENASIYVSIYLFDHSPIIEALIDASEREVKLFIMTDESDRSSNLATLSKFKSLEGEIEVVGITNDASSIAINHNKFILLSEVEVEGTENIENIIFQTSQNFHSKGQKKLQDAIIISNPGLYDAYVENWNTMKTFANSGMENYEYTEYINTEAEVKVSFYPKRKNGQTYGEDSVIEILDQITDPAGTTIKIAMSDWSDSRSYIIDHLLILLEAGADIQIITKSGKGPEVMQGLKKLQDHGAFVKVFNLDNTGPAQINIHTKIMLIDGILDGMRTKFVMTGTQNFTLNALWNNNETSLFLMNEDLIEEYESFLNELKELPGIVL
ncbi:phosphatidylserine/phosphatidylglycerophosphate/cardiolipin synthase family protein [Gramella sp. KN1008]|uniref:phospholipase D-like domain-containing protein n=1 Tax=Gramella sp. KN1008 TaxID=2529298 RepID=UPI0013F1706A|nr:phospholipase D-like domain-containing protein [Gramella sp. KN1008]